MRISDWSSDVCSSDLPGDFVQALMDLGAGICTPRSPACAICPVMADCRARGRADIERLPVKPAKKAKPQRHGVAHWIERDGCIWLVRRPEKGMPGGRRELTGGEWGGTPVDSELSEAKRERGGVGKRGSVRGENRG